MKQRKTDFKKTEIWQRLTALLLTLFIVTTTVGGQTVQAAQLSNDGSPWVDYDLQQNLSGNVTPNPRDDFYLYVNHEWLANAKIAEGNTSTDSFQEVEDETVKNAKAILEDKTLKSHDAKLIQKLNREYLNWEARNKVGIKPLKSTVKAIKNISSMKELSDFICNNEDLTYGVPKFVNFSNDVSYNDSSSYVTSVYGDSLLLGDAAEYTKRTEMGDRYYKACRKEAVEMLKRLGYSSKEAGKMYERVIKFEGQLAKASFSIEDAMSPDYIQKTNNVMKKDKTEKLMKNFPLKRYMKASGYGKSKNYCVTEPKYIKQVDKLYTKKNLKVIKEYMLVHYLSNMICLLDRKAFDLRIQSANMISGSSGKLDDKEYAYLEVSALLSVPLQKVYLKKYNAEEKKEKITQLCKEVIANYRQMLSNATWLSEQTRQKAIEKLDAMKINVIYPDQWEDYSKLNLDGKSYVECYKAIINYEKKANQACTNKKVEKSQWFISTLEANAAYNMQDNSINILLGILGGDFYRDDMSKEELYAGIGSVIGHEISHAFDTNGCQYDAEGNLADWWTKEDYKAFQKRADKLVAYYDKIVAFAGKQVSGTNVQSEAIADITGMQCILGIAAKEKNFDYDKFFKQYAKVWKQITTPEDEEYNLQQNVHPLNYLRTNVTVQQFDEFYDTYHVQKGDNMYLAPEDRLTVW